MTATAAPLHRRILAGDIGIGDFVARARTHRFTKVADLRGGRVSVRLLDEKGQTIARPRKDAKWWVIDQEQATLRAVGLQSLDALIEELQHFLKTPIGSWRMEVPRREIQRRLDVAQAEWERREGERG